MMYHLVTCSFSSKLAQMKWIYVLVKVYLFPRQKKSIKSENILEYPHIILTFLTVKNGEGNPKTLHESRFVGTA